MKQIDKKDMPKLIALIVLAVGLFGYAIFSVAGASAPPPAAAAKPAVPAPGQQPGAVASATDPAGKTAAEGDDAAARPAFDPALIAFPTGGKDPFAPVAGLSRDMVVALAPAPLPVAPVVSPLAAGPPIDTSAFEKLIAPAKTAPVENIKPMLPPPPPPPSFVVTGIVMGDAGQGDHRHVAILRGSGVGGSEERRFVVGGDDVGNGFVVSVVHSYGVELREKFGSRRRVLLKLGENAADKLRSPAATPTAPQTVPQAVPQPQAAPSPAQPQSAINQNNLGDNARATK